MRRPRRGLVLLAILFALSVAVLTVPRFEIDTFLLNLDRGDEENLLGLSLGLDLEGGSHLVYKATKEDGYPADADDLEGVDIVKNAFDQHKIRLPLAYIVLDIQPIGYGKARKACRTQHFNPGYCRCRITPGHHDICQARHGSSFISATLKNWRWEHLDCYLFPTNHSRGSRFGASKITN